MLHILTSTQYSQYLFLAILISIWQSHCGFNLHFYHDWTSFQVRICHLCTLFDKVSIRVFCLLFSQFAFLFLSFENSLYNLDTNSLLYMWYTNISSQSVIYFFKILLTVYCAEQKLFFFLFEWILMHFFFFYGLHIYVSL